MEKYLVENCAPTLASLKTANLFSYDCFSLLELEAYIAYWNQRMKEKGISMCVLRYREHTALIYVYRKVFLKKDMDKPGVQEFLHGLGYEHTGIGYMLGKLKKRLTEGLSFPHEIGLFLGYPLGDVIGFVENSGKSYIYAGCWKVYCNAAEAVYTFQKFKKCTEVYVRLWSQGRRSVWELTVSV